MTHYQNLTKNSIKQELNEVKHLLHLVRNMDRPNNFTYMDVTMLHKHLEDLRDYLYYELSCKEEQERVS